MAHGHFKFSVARGLQKLAKMKFAIFLKIHVPRSTEIGQKFSVAHGHFKYYVAHGHFKCSVAQGHLKFSVAHGHSKFSVALGHFKF